MRYVGTGPSSLSLLITCATRSGRERAFDSNDMRPNESTCASVPGDTTEKWLRTRT